MEAFMDWEKQYSQKMQTAESAIRQFIHSGDKIYIGGVTVGTAGINTLFRLVDEGQLTNLKLYCVCTCNPGLELDKYHFSPEQMTIETYFMTGTERHYMSERKMFHTPMQFSMYDRCIQSVDPDVCLVVLTPPDEDGYCNIGPHCFSCTPLAGAKRIIGQISSSIPRVNGTAHRIHVSQIDAFFEAEEELAMAGNFADVSPEEEKIADLILNYIKNGACIQLGYGGIANAIGFKLKSLCHLGVHTEVLTESIMELIESGVVDNSRKNYFPGQSSVGFVFGSQKQYQYIDQNKEFIFGTFSEIVNPQVIASIDNMISINGAVSVDITGQVCAESIRGRQYSGTGGQVDFVRGASMSKGGYSFIAFPSTANTKSGRVSRIVFSLDPGSIVTTPRTDVQWVATEYGCVNLQYKSIPDRVKALVSIAHPDYRSELLFSAREAGLTY